MSKLSTSEREKEMQCSSVNKMTNEPLYRTSLSSPFAVPPLTHILSSEAEAKHWQYRGEGALNLVLTYIGPRSIYASQKNHLFFSYLLFFSLVFCPSDTFLLDGLDLFRKTMSWGLERQNVPRLWSQRHSSHQLQALSAARQSLLSIQSSMALY